MSFQDILVDVIDTKKSICIKTDYYSNKTLNNDKSKIVKKRDGKIKIVRK